MMDKLWGTKELAEYLGIPKQTIYQWRTKGYGPPGRRIGKYVKYLPSDVERWVTALPSSHPYRSPPAGHAPQDLHV